MTITVPAAPGTQRTTNAAETREHYGALPGERGD
jgi:hypothetical protein